MYGKDDVPAAGLVTGIGRVSGQECVIVANDADKKGGTYYPVSVKSICVPRTLHNKIIKLASIWWIWWRELAEQDEVFPDKEHFGRIFFNQANMSAQNIPQIAVVMVRVLPVVPMPAMADEAIIVRNQGTIFLGGPPLVKMATGEEVTAEELGGADVHTGYRVLQITMREMITMRRIARQAVSRLHRVKPAVVDLAEAKEPLYSASDLLGIVPKMFANL